MSGTHSNNSTNQLKTFLDGVSQIPSITLCDPRQLKEQRYSQTSTGISRNNFFLDRETGKTLVIEYPSFDLKTNWNLLPPSKLIVLLKCLLILQSLPESALEDAVKELERIADFYSDYFPQANLPIIPATSIKGKLKSSKVRSPIVLEA